MRYESTTAPYRTFYAYLLRLYPKSYRERFGQGMDQTFHDICRQRIAEGKGLFAFSLWAFGDTIIGIISLRISYLFTLLRMQKKIIRLAIGVLLFLLIPLALTIRDGNVEGVGWNWSAGDFVFAFVLIFGTGLAYILISQRMPSRMYRYAVGVGLATAFALVWGNAAVGLIGEPEDGSAIPTNLMYLGMLLVGFIAACVVRFRPRPMSYILLALAAVQMLIPVIALIAWGSTNFARPGVLPIFILSAIFAALFAGSGVLFQQAAIKKV